MTTSTLPGAAARFADRFDTPIPHGLRDQADLLTWEDFFTAYGPTAGPVRLGQFCRADAGRPGARLGSGTYRATIAVGGRIGTSTASATGPLAALTAMLYDRGIAVEMLGFHQLRSCAHTATFINGSNGVRALWAMGWSTDPAQSALSAVIACANRLLTT